MTASTFRVLALSSLIAAIAPLGIMAQEPVYFKIPFGFTIGSRTLAPGQYRVTEPVRNVLHFQGEGRNQANIIALEEQPGKSNGLVTLTFHRYGNEYFFANMVNPSKGWGLPESAHEKALMEARTSSKSLDIVASSKAGSRRP